MARGLKTRRSRLVALLVPEIVNSFYTTISRGVEDVANANGYCVVLGNSDESISKEKTYVELMAANHSAGIVVAPAGRSAGHLRVLRERGIPTVVVDRPVDGFWGDVVRGDSHGGAVELTQHLLGLGHREIAFVNGDPKTAVARDREAGFRLALDHAGVRVVEELVSRGTWFIDDAERRVDNLLRSAHPFTAIFAANNFMAIGALRALRRHRRRVPEDIAVVCFDDIEVAAQIDPFLTVMAQPAYTMGTLAMQMLLDRITGKHAGEKREIVLSPRLLVRRSCGSRPRGWDELPVEDLVVSVPEAAATPIGS
jgi:LacI family transcriptional regulator